MTPNALSAAGGRGYLKTPLGRWYCEEHGARRHPGDPTIVLLHGLMLDGRMWAAQLARLREVGRVLVLDGPGHGYSDVPPPFTLDEQADALGEALLGVAAQRAILVGHDWGAMVSLRMALRQPAQVAGLVLTGATAESETALGRLGFRLLLGAVRRLRAPRWLVEAALARLVYGPRARRLRPALVGELHRLIREQRRGGLAPAAEAVLQRDAISHRLSEVAAPVLVACGRDDTATEPFRSEALARGIPGARLVWMACGHTPPQERPEDFTMAVVPFLRRTLSSRPVQDSDRATA